jgi:hypothetical protein
MNKWLQSASPRIAVLMGLVSMSYVWATPSCYDPDPLYGNDCSYWGHLTIPTPNSLNCQACSFNFYAYDWPYGYLGDAQTSGTGERYKSTGFCTAYFTCRDANGFATQCNSSGAFSPARQVWTYDSNGPCGSS